MSIIIIFNNKDPKPWAKSLTEKLPQTVIQVYPNGENPDLVEFAVCWKPEKKVLNQFPNLKVIQSVGAAIDHITRTQDIKKGQILTRIVDENLSNDMWEFLLAAVMSNLKNLPRYFRQKDDKIWQQTGYGLIKNTTISILGLGKIGAFVAAQFAALGFIVKGWSQSDKTIENVQCFVGQNELTDFLNDTDLLINILPLTDVTENILDKMALKQVKKGSFLINVGRGEHLVESDLLELLDEDYLTGALLDVFRLEPLPQEHPFWSHPKIQITPHIASVTNVETAANQVAGNYVSYMSGKGLQNIVSMEKGY
jgi:glyoxylate/hydroxypyruvate reductase